MENAREMTEPAIVQFGTLHTYTIFFSAVAMFLACALPWLWASDKQRHIVGVCMAIFFVVHDLWMRYMHWTLAEYTWVELLPFHLCGSGTYFLAAALILRNRFLYEIMYFWALAGALQAFITPTVQWPFPHPGFFAYFISHMGMLLPVFYMTANYAFRPTAVSILKASAFTGVYFAAIIFINLGLGTNFLFICAPAPGDNPFKFLGTWPWYVLNLIPLTFVLFCVAYSPWIVYDRLSRREANAASW